MNKIPDPGDDLRAALSLCRQIDKALRFHFTGAYAGMMPAYDPDRDIEYVRLRREFLGVLDRIEGLGFMPMLVEGELPTALAHAQVQRRWSERTEGFVRHFLGTLVERLAELPDYGGDEPSTAATPSTGGRRKGSLSRSKRQYREARDELIERLHRLPTQEEFAEHLVGTTTAESTVRSNLKSWGTNWDNFIETGELPD